MARGANTWERLSYKQCDRGLEDRDGGFPPTASHFD